MKYHDNIWFPPANILYHGNRKLTEKKTAKTDIKHIKEAISAAIMLTGIMRITNLMFYMQIVDPQQRTPDIRTMHLLRISGRPNQMLEQDVEIVTLEEHSDEEVDDFLKRTKLHSGKSYPETTIILCHINKTIRQNKSLREVHNSLKNSSQQNDVYILGRVKPDSQTYRLIKIHPELEVYEDYDVVVQLKSRPYQRVLKLLRGSKDELVETDTMTIPFE